MGVGWGEGVVNRDNRDSRENPHFTTKPVITSKLLWISAGIIYVYWDLMILSLSALCKVLPVCITWMTESIILVRSEDWGMTHGQRTSSLVSVSFHGRLVLKCLYDNHFISVK